MASFVIICFYMENYSAYQEHIRYSFSHYIVLVVVFSGIIGDDVWSNLPLQLTDAVLIGLLIVLLVMFLARVVVLSRRFEEDSDYEREETTRLVKI